MLRQAAALVFKVAVVVVVVTKVGFLNGDIDCSNLHCVPLGKPNNSFTARLKRGEIALDEKSALQLLAKQLPNIRGGVEEQLQYFSTEVTGPVCS